MTATYYIVRTKTAGKNGKFRYLSTRDGRYGRKTGMSQYLTFPLIDCDRYGTTEAARLAAERYLAQQKTLTINDIEIACVVVNATENKMTFSVNQIDKTSTLQVIQKKTAE